MEKENDKNTQLLLYLISSFELAAMQQMGKIKDPLLDKLEKNLQQAQFSIDLLDMLKEKTKGNISEYESKYIDNVVAQLKLNYVDELEKEKKEKETEGKQETKPEEKKEEDKK
jgi:hypothetical protein